ncbi:hypothetical protein N431DRAFT_97148 [Stipitochalara longipes BDJ]|nr:hypothetical protein N431DRAFT_97148 [Stipitochalara longipes BDJ]
MWLAQPQSSLPYSGCEQIIPRIRRVPSVSSSPPASFPTRRHFLCHASRAADFVSCGSIFVFFFNVVFDSRMRKGFKISVHRGRIEKRTWASIAVFRLTGNKCLFVFRPLGFESACIESAEDRH